MTKQTRHTNIALYLGASATSNCMEYLLLFCSLQMQALHRVYSSTKKFLQLELHKFMSKDLRAHTWACDLNLSLPRLLSVSNTTLFTNFLQHSFQNYSQKR